VDARERPSLVGKTVSHYRINSSVGAGGMGEVYRATDTKLGRDVALKVLPADMARDADRLARFQREARAVAALNHPNVVTIYSVEHSEDLQFITMELIEGRPLEHLIPEDGLALDRIVEIASALADALAAAHEKGIIHRDLKPANVMVTNEGRVKVLDFGLAKDMAADRPNDSTMTSAGVTQAGLVMGTPSYMSPEQVSGRTLDHRTDIFSLGVMLHEMATGRRPFHGTSSAELISAILRDQPAPVTELRPDLPADLARIIRRCLEKDPRRRVQTARDVSNEFRDLTQTGARAAAPVATPSRSTTGAGSSGSTAADHGFWVAVLPFRCNCADPGVATLADGLSEEIITGLSRFSYLRVTAQSSTARYAGQQVDARSAARELNARYVMEGSLRQAGSKLRLAVQLVEAATGTHLWAETFERTFSTENVFELQDELVPRIVSTVADMHGVLPRSMSEALRGRSEDSLTPHEALLRSFSYFFRSVPEEHAAVRRILEHAVEQAPDLADAWAMLAMMYFIEYADEFNPRLNPLDRGLAAAQRAISLASTHALGHYSLAWVHFFRKEWVPMRAAVERAVVLNPMDGSVIGLLGILVDHSGDEERGKQMVETAMRLNPNHPGILHFVAVNRAYRQGKYAEALEAAVRINLPGFFYYYASLAAARGQLGQHEAAQRDLRELLALRPNFAAEARKDFLKWWTPEVTEHMLDGLRKAGLQIDDESARPAVEKSGPGSTTIASGSTRADEGFWVAVLPFKSTGSGADLAALAEGLTDDIVTGMSKFSYLRVIARSSTARYANQAADARAVAKELGARYVLEGSIRHAGAKVRIAAQLVDAIAGTSLWAETYDRPFDPDATLDLLDDVVPRIVATVGDTQGILAHSMTEALRGRDPETFTPHEALLRSFGFHQHVNAAEHMASVKALERAVEQAPDRADCWAMLSWLYRAEHSNSFNPRPNAMDRSLVAAQRAVALAPASHLANAALASAFFFRRELGPFRPAAERALALNNMEGYITAFLGMHFAYAGDWERGCALSERATQLNPNHPGWYWLAPVMNAYRRHDSERALELALRMNMPGLWTAQAALTAIYAQMGNMEKARAALRDLLELRPDFADVASHELEKFWLPELAEQLLGDLRKAGLDAPDAGAPRSSLPSGTSAARTASGETRADEGFWVAVLPFKYSGASPDLKALAEGISDEVITGLSRFSYLRVVARGSTAKYLSESGDIRAIGKELGARYVMEGSIRQAGTKLRLAVQLADATTGTHLWAENYERPFNTDALFELQDDLVPRIVSTVADYYGILPHSICEALRRRKADDELSPYEAVLRAFSYFERVTLEEHARVRDILERAARVAPNQGEIWAMLATVYWHEHSLGFNPQPDPLGRALAAARRSIDVAPTNNLGYSALATVFYLQRDIPAFRSMAERAIEMNPMDGSNLAHVGLLTAYSGDWERGCALAESALKLNPHHPGWYWFASFLNAYRKEDYRSALAIALKFNLPGYFTAHAFTAAVYGQLGMREQAQKSLQDLLRLRPDFAASAREELGHDHDAKLIEHIIDGLRKAGLEIPEAGVAHPAPPSSDAFPVASGGTHAVPSIAVLPFANMSADRDQEYFSDGLAEEIINLLAQMNGLKVIARTSSFAFRGKEQDIRQIADALNVTQVLEGSVRRSGSRIRITAQLIQAADGSHLYSERFDRELSDIFAVQDEIAAAIAKALRVRLSPQAASPHYTPKLEAYEAFLRAKYFQVQVTPESLEMARRYFEQTIELDPGFGLAHIGLGNYWLSVAHFGRHSVHECVPAARAEARRALEIEPSLPEAHALLGYLAAMYDMDWEAAERHFAFPMAKQAKFELVRNLYGGVQFFRGNAEEAVRLAKESVEEDPLDVWAHMNLHADLQAAGRDSEALEELKKVLELDPNQVVALVSMAMIYNDHGDRAESMKIARRAYAVGPWFPDTIGVLAAFLRRDGNLAESEALLKALGSGETTGDARAFALYHLLSGEIDQGADWAEKAIEQRDPSMMYYLRFVVSKPLRASHRWPKIAKTINLPPAR